MKVKVNGAWVDVPAFKVKDTTWEKFVIDWCNGALTTAKFPEGVTTILQYGFVNQTHIEAIELPTTIVSLGTACFRWCMTLSALVVRATQPPTTASNIFDGMYKRPTIYVPDASVDAYKTATNWSAWASNIKPLSEYQG